MSIYTGFQPSLPLPHFCRIIETPSLFLDRCCCPGGFAVPVATRDGETVQYVSGEYVDHVAGENEPGSAVDQVSYAPWREAEMGLRTLGLSRGKAGIGNRCVRCCRSLRNIRCTLYISSVLPALLHSSKGTQLHRNKCTIIP